MVQSQERLVVDIVVHLVVERGDPLLHAVVQALDVGCRLLLVVLLREVHLVLSAEDKLLEILEEPCRLALQIASSGLGSLKVL